MSTSSRSSSTDQYLIKYIPEHKALKQERLGQIDDDSPNFTLEDAEVYMKDGKTFANLLHCDIDGPFIVRGKLCIEDHEVKELRCLVSKKLAHSYIEFSTSQYSIGELPTTVWAAGGAGWFEIYPSPAYSQLHESMMKGIELYYGLIQVYENALHLGDKYWRTKLTAEDVFIQYGLNNGTGLYRSEILARIHDNSQFLLCHLSKADQGLYSATSLYKHLQENFKDTYERLLQRQRQMIAFRVVRPSIPPEKKIAVAATSNVDHGGSEIGGHFKGADARGVRLSFKRSPSSNNLSERNASTQKSTSQTPEHDTTANSSTEPPSMLGSSRNPARTSAQIAEVLLECAESLLNEGKERRRITLLSVGSQLYKDYKIPQHYAAPEIAKHFARALLARLPADWKLSTLHETCRDERPVSYNQLSSAAKNILQLGLVRRDRVTQKRSSLTLKGQRGDGARRARRSPFALDPLSPGSASPHRLLGDAQGHYAGKIPSLRTPGSSLMPRSESPENDDFGKGDVFVSEQGRIPPELLEKELQPPRKRSRPGATYNQDNLPLFYPNGEESLLDEYVQFDIVAENFPVVAIEDHSLSATISATAAAGDTAAVSGASIENTPSPTHISTFDDTTVFASTGLWLCPLSPCDFILREVNSDGGKRGYLRHKEFHEMQESVLKEAKFSGSSVSHLMEKIKAVGETRLEKEREIINGKVVKPRIMRRGVED